MDHMDSMATLPRSDHDVVVVGAGMIGLTIARHILVHSDLSVTVVDAKVPCSGATGAGQGYIWMGHETPDSDLWKLAMRSKQLWEGLAQSLEYEGIDPLQELGWRKTGSLILGRSSDELAMLNKRVEEFSKAGLRAEFLTRSALLAEEPEIDVGEQGGAAFFPDDCQLDAKRTVSFLEKSIRSFASEGRYSEFYNDPAVSLRIHANGEVEALETSKNILYVRKAIVIAAGTWTGSLMRNLVKSIDVPEVPVKPRKGHLLVVENEGKIKINHGIMECDYIGHLPPEIPHFPNTKGNQYVHGTSSVSMTATTDSSGNLLLGSSRQFSGFDVEAEDTIVKRIWERCGEFMPSIRELPLDAFRNNIRVGLRPWMPNGKPIISPVPGLPKAIVAAGHEGDGLSLALGTAEMVADMILGNKENVPRAPFSFS